MKKKEKISPELILEAKTKYEAEAIKEIVEYFKIEQFDEKTKGGCCPLREEKTPSFIWCNKMKAFKCFGCGQTFNIIDLYMHQGMSFLQSIQKLFDKVGIEHSIKDIKYNNDYFNGYKYPKPETNTNRENVEQYLSKRGISKQTLDYCGVKEDLNKNIVFEFLGLNNELLATKYRPARALKKNADGKKEQMMWWQNNASNCPILYNISKIDIHKPIVIVEGLIDSLSCVEVGIVNTVSIPGAATDRKFIEFNYDFLDKFSSIIIYGDNDEPGKQLQKNILDSFGIHRVKFVTPEKYHEDQVNEYYKQFGIECRKTDANNILIAMGGQELVKLIENAKEIEDGEIKDLMDFEYFSIQDREKFPTGIKNLDRIIYGHLLSTVNLYIAETGAGKSTAINQLAIRPFLETKEPMFIFSGEMKGDKVFSWIVDSVGGYNHTIEWDNGVNCPKGYSISKQAIVEIKKYYRGIIKLYDKKGVTTTSELFAKIEYCRKKYGIKHFFIDNLMCLCTQGSDEDKWGSQIRFGVELMDYAEHNNVAIHLVAHSRKPASGQNKKDNDKEVQRTIYDMSGASELCNVAHRAFWIERVVNKDHQSEIIVIKDRETGQEGKRAKLFFDFKTKRLYSDKDELYYQHNWEKTAKIKYPEHINKKLICNLYNKKEIAKVEKEKEKLF